MRPDDLLGRAVGTGQDMKTAEHPECFSTAACSALRVEVVGLAGAPVCVLHLQRACLMLDQAAISLRFKEDCLKKVSQDLGQGGKEASGAVKDKQINTVKQERGVGKQGSKFQAHAGIPQCADREFSLQRVISRSVWGQGSFSPKIAKQFIFSC